MARPQDGTWLIHLQQLDASDVRTRSKRAETEARLQREYRDDIDIERLASELVIDAIVSPETLRDEIAARLATAKGRRDVPPAKWRSVTPV